MRLTDALLLATSLEPLTFHEEKEREEFTPKLFIGLEKKVKENVTFDPFTLIIM